MRQKVCLTILLCALALPVSAQNRAGDFHLTRISRELITTPHFNYEGGEQQRETRQRWLRVEVQFSATPDYTDELTFKYFLAIGGKVLTGEMTHVSVLAGRELYSSAYVAPHALAYLLQNRAPTTNSVENIAVQILQKGEVKDELSMVRARPDWFSALPAVTGFVLNKNETPFAPLFWDHYEQLKPAGH